MANVFLFAVAWLVCAATARADPGYYVVTPYEKAGLRTLELRYWTVKRPNEPEIIWPELGAGYGINSRWTTNFLTGKDWSKSYESGKIRTLGINLRIGVSIARLLGFVPMGFMGVITAMLA